MRAPDVIRTLVARFAEHQERYTAPSYKEAHLRSEFLDQFFIALGWDVGNTRNLSEGLKDVVVEDSLNVEGTARAPDYAFRIGGQTQFYAEAKRPSENLKANPEHAFQLRRYVWTKRLAIGALTDFQELAIYDGRVRPGARDDARTARLHYFRFDEFESRWKDIANLLSKTAIENGALEAMDQARPNRRGDSTVDDVFLSDIESWRALLAKNLRGRNPDLSIADLNFAVQRTIDRIVFLRICEDRSIEQWGRLKEAAAAPKVYSRLIDIFKDADNRYNSGLFHFRREAGRHEPPDDLTISLAVDDRPLRSIIDGLYPPVSPYAFKVLPADILGQVYERFLGNTIVPRGRGIAIEPKPEVRKAGGVYYTPTYVVDYIVEATLGDLLRGKQPKDIATVTVLDPACGSGSFLVQAFDVLLRWYLNWYSTHTPNRFTTGKAPALRESVGKGWQLTTQEKKRILLRHVFGVDIDAQAVEVTKLSLLLKVLEDETSDQLSLLHERALPDLGNNIKCGNSLIDPSYYSGDQLGFLDENREAAVNAFSWEGEFPEIMQRRGFDAVVGNPPYVLLQDEFRDDEQLAYFKRRYSVAAFKIDTYHLFMERAIELTRPSGHCSMITPTNFLTNNHLTALRKLLLSKTRIDRLLIVDKGVFKGISVDNAIWVVTPGTPPNHTFTIEHVRPVRNSLQIISQGSFSVPDSLESENALFTGAVNHSVAAMWKKVQGASRDLASVANVNFGKQLRDRTKYREDVLEVASLRQVPAGYRPCYTGTDVRRYSIRWNGLACRTNRDAQRGGCWDDDKQNAKNKLLTKQIGRYPDFGMDRRGYQCLNTIFMVSLTDPSVDPRFVLACLNSRVVRAWWIDKYFDQRRTFPKIKGTYLKRLPIPKHASKALHRHICSLVDRRTALAEDLLAANRATETTRIERSIETCERLLDQAVSRAYGLADDDAAALEALLCPPSQAAAVPTRPVLADAPKRRKPA